MSEAFQPRPFLLAEKNWSASTSLEFPMTGLPPIVGAELPHVVSIDIELDLDPTYTTVPTNVQHNSALNALSIWDGQREWLPTSCDLNLLRATERMENGNIVGQDAILGNGSTNNRYIRRRFYWNPPSLYGQPADGAYNTAFLSKAGMVRMNCSPLTAISADCTAATGKVRVFCNLVPYFDKLIFPAHFVRRLEGVTNGQIFTQNALYAWIAFLNSSSYDAFAAGDIGQVSLTFADQVLKAVDAQALTASFNADFKKSLIEGVAGEPRDATYDVNARQVNLTTPTAFSAQTADLQPVAWAPPGCKLTKLRYYAPTQMQVNFSGSNSGTQMISGRYQPVEAADRLQQVQTALSQAQRGANVAPPELRMASGKQQYEGNYRKFFPLEVDLAKLPMAA